MTISIAKPPGKVSICFAFTRGASKTAVYLQWATEERNPLLEDPGALSLSFGTCSPIQAQISTMDQRGSSFCFSVVVRGGVGSKGIGSVCCVEEIILKLGRYLVSFFIPSDPQYYQE